MEDNNVAFDDWQGHKDDSVHARTVDFETGHRVRDGELVSHIMGGEVEAVGAGVEGGTGMFASRLPSGLSTNDGSAGEPMSPTRSLQQISNALSSLR